MKIVRHINSLFLVLFIAGAFFSTPLSGQFYNGTNINFGKNSVQYKDFLWSFYEYKRFNIYFYTGGKDLADFAAQSIDRNLKEIETFFEFTIENDMQFIIYNTLNDFKQSNIGLETEGDGNTGGTTKIVGNKVFIYYQGNHKKLEEQIRSSVVQLVLNKALYGESLAQQVKNEALLTLPEWYTEGLKAFLAEGWNSAINDRVKDGIYSRTYEKFSRLFGQQAIDAGHSFWKYIFENYDKKAIPNILYMTKITRNFDLGFYYILGKNTQQLRQEWLLYFDNAYHDIEQSRDSLLLHKAVLKPKKNRVYNQFKVSYEDNYYAYTTNQMGMYKVFLINKTTGKKKKLLKEGYKLDEETDYSYPLLQFHPTSNILTIIREYRGKILLEQYNIEDDVWDTKELFYFDKVLSFSYSQDGRKLAISAIIEGKTDVFVYYFTGHTYQKITNDVADDLDPIFMDNDSQLVFASNRLNDTLGVNPRVFNYAANFDLYSCYLNTDNPVLNRITKTDYNEHALIRINEKQFGYISDINGIENEHWGKLDSVINFIDTTIHYKQITTTVLSSDYRRNILEHAVNRKSKTSIFRFNNRYYLFSQPLSNSLEKKAKDTIVIDSPFNSKKAVKKDLENSNDSIPQNRTDSIPKKKAQLLYLFDLDVGEEKVDINNYKFGEGDVPVKKDTLVNNEVVLPQKPLQVLAKQQNYNITFFPSEITSQLDMSYLSPSYQVYTGGGELMTPGLNGFFKLATTDLFEDYKFTGGVKLSTDFNSKEYFFSYEDLKKQLDKQYVFYRKSLFSKVNEDYIRLYSNEVSYKLKYPFDRVQRIEAGLLARNNQTVYIAYDTVTLNKKSNTDFWAGINTAFVYDNTRKAGSNAYFGTRYKLFAEWQRQLDKKQTNLYAIGFDYRKYLPISRTFIWANRLAGSTSFGQKKIAYFLGSTDNWLNLSSRPTFNDNNPPLPEEVNSYVYQALASNMRGFSQNVRNGNNFIVLNSELRFPIVAYFSKRPIRSSFFRTLQLIGFYDVGGAWVGWNPFSEKNTIRDTLVFQSPNFSVNLIHEKYPIVTGYGFGIRARILGYFMRFDWAWGMDTGIKQPRIFYLSLSQDF